MQCAGFLNQQLQAQHGELQAPADKVSSLSWSYWQLLCCWLRVLLAGAPV
jgi:hypothetical protein